MFDKIKQNKNMQIIFLQHKEFVDFTLKETTSLESRSNNVSA